MQIPNYNHPHNYPLMYSHMCSRCNHISHTYTYNQPTVSAYIHTRLYISASNCLSPTYMHPKLNVYIYIYIYVPTYTDTYPNVSTFCPTIGKVSECIQTSQTYPSTPKQIQTQGNISGHRNNSIHRYIYQIHQHMPGQKYAPKHPNLIFKHTPTPDKYTRGHINLNKY